MNKLISTVEIRNSYGHSFISVNLALAILHRVNKEVAIADVSTGSNNDLHVLLNLEPQKNLAEAKHPSGLSVMQGSAIHANLPRVQDVFEWVIVKADSSCIKNIPVLLDLSGMILLLVDANVLAIKETQFFLNELKSIHYPFQLLKILVKATQSANNIPSAEIQKYLGIEILGEIIDEPGIIQLCINQGKPAVLSHPHCVFSRSIKGIADRIVRDESRIFVENTALLLDFKKSRDSTLKTDNDAFESEKVVQIADRDKLILELKAKIHRRLLQELDLNKIEFKSSTGLEKQKEIRKITQTKIEHILSEEGKEVYSREERTMIVNEMMNEVLGLGPLEPLLSDSKISEIMVNGKDNIYIEKSGKITLSDAHFDSDSQILTVIDRILAPIGRRVDESSPLVDARLADGSRVNVIIPPLSLIGPSITIRKFFAKKLCIGDLIKLGSLTQDMVDFMSVSVAIRKNMIVSGGTGSGKTTMLNMLSSFIPEDERIVTIEDSAELKLKQKHVVTLESRPASVEGTGEVPIRRLVINALRMRPDRIIVGECRGGEPPNTYIH